MSGEGWGEQASGSYEERPNGAAGGWGQNGRTPSPGRGDRRSRSPEPRRMEVDDRRERGGGDRDRGRGGDSQNPGNNLHVSGLSLKITEADLEKAFSVYGRVQKAQVMRDPHTDDPRGFGFVTMETAEEAEAATTALNGTELIDKVLRIEKARRGRARTPTPGAYHGPPKREFDSRPPRYDDDRRRDRRDDRGYSSYAVPMRDDRRDDRRYDDRRDDRRDGRDRYDDRRGGDRDRYDDRRYDDRRSSRYDDYDDRRR